MKIVIKYFLCLFLILGFPNKYKFLVILILNVIGVCLLLFVRLWHDGLVAIFSMIFLGSTLYA